MALADAAIWEIPAKQAGSWSVAQKGTIVEVGFGAGDDFPQYAALHTKAGFLRLNYGRDSGWGTSLILLPSFWERGRYYQGAKVSVAWRVDVADFVMSFSSSLSNLGAFGEVRLNPPAANLISCSVKVTTDGGLDLDRRPGEAFKPVTLSSMHVSVNQWDAKLVEVELESFPIPESGWIVRPPIVGSRFALRGGSSTWKWHAPSLEIVLDTDLELTGWKTESSNPDDDNLAFWAATDHVLKSWNYTVTANAQNDSDH